MRPRKGESEDLRLAAKAADRGKVAEQQWPAFEKRLSELGYSPLAIAHAFSTLSGPGTIAEARARGASYTYARIASHRADLRSQRGSRRSLGGEPRHDHVRRTR